MLLVLNKSKTTYLCFALMGCFLALSDSFQMSCLPLLHSSRLRAIRSSSSAHRTRIETVKMVYTPPRSGVTLEELKEQLDRQIAIPSPPSRESPKVGVSRYFHLKCSIEYLSYLNRSQEAHAHLCTAIGDLPQGQSHGGQVLRTHEPLHRLRASLS
jgi:hypothetical protein